MADLSRRDRERLLATVIVAIIVAALVVAATLG